MNSFLDDIFENKILFDKEDLVRAFNEKIPVDDPVLKNIDMTDSTLEDLMEDFRQNPERPFTKKEAKIIAAKLDRAKKDCKDLLGVVKERKELLNNLINKSNKSFTLNISRSTQLRQAATNTFGGRKQEITYDDYMTLIELKKVIEMQETLDLLDSGVEDGSV